MSIVDVLFVGIFRFSAIALIMLTASLLSLRWLKQPLERIRLIQISLLALFAAIILGAAGVLPSIELAVLPVADDSQVASSLSVFDRIVLGSNRNADVADITEPWQQSTGAAQAGSAQAGSAQAGSAQAGSAQAGNSQAGNSQAGGKSGGGADRRAASTATQDASDATLLRAGSENAFEVMVLIKAAVVYGWLVISGLNVVYLAMGWIATRRLVSSAKSLSEAATINVERIVNEFSKQGIVRFVSSTKTDVPMVCGVWRPTVLLPEALACADADQLELKHSLAHEWGHIQRRDLLTWQLANLCQMFLWIQPGYWTLRRELRLAQDQMADQFATRQTNEHATYAATLVQLSRARQPMLTGALTMAGGNSNLYRRVEMLLNDQFQMVRVTRKPVMLFLGGLISVAGGLLSSLQVTQAETTTLLASAQEQPVKSDDEKGKSQKSIKAIADTPDDAAKSVEHSGIVVDTDTGKPIAGATVTVTRMISSDWREVAVTKSTTDENGKYTFSIPPEQLRESYLYILFDLDHPTYAGRHCGSYGYEMIAKNLKAGEQPWFSKLKMVQGEKILGRLVDENQRPVAGAQLRADTNSGSNFDFDDGRRTNVDGVSDQDGRFTLVVPNKGKTNLSIIPTDQCMVNIELGEKRGNIDDISLVQGFSIQGSVRDAKGQPLEGLWVNIAPEDPQRAASYEMKRSSKTDAQGNFQTRPIKSGKYLVEVETKATGALEKEKYANFHDEPPPAMFVAQTIHVTEESARQPYVIQAVPHVLITVQHYKPNGEISSGHSPTLFGQVDGKFFHSQRGKKVGKGAYQLMAPHGLDDVRLQFITNEQSALMVQFENGKLSAQDSYRFPKLEGDINNIRVIRYPAAILKVKIVDESGAEIKDARIFANYAVEKVAGDEAMMSSQIGFNREGDTFRLSSIVPGTPVTVRASQSGFQSKTETVTMKEEERRTITITLEPVKEEETNGDVQKDVQKDSQ